MIEFLAGAATVGYLIAAGFFTRYWVKTEERLFLYFAIAFALFALNQALASALTVIIETTSAVYVLRVLGFVIIIVAIVDKNVFPGGSEVISRVLRRK